MAQTRSSAAAYRTIDQLPLTLIRQQRLNLELRKGDKRREERSTGHFSIGPLHLVLSPNLRLLSRSIHRDRARWQIRLDKIVSLFFSFRFGGQRILLLPLKQRISCCATEDDIDSRSIAKPRKMKRRGKCDHARRLSITASCGQSSALRVVRIFPE